MLQQTAEFFVLWESARIAERDRFEDTTIQPNQKSGWYEEKAAATGRLRWVV